MGRLPRHGRAADPSAEAARRPAPVGEPSPPRQPAAGGTRAAGPSSARRRHFGNRRSMRESRLQRLGPYVALITIRARNSIAYIAPVPMSVDPGPYGPPNPSGTAQMNRLRIAPPA